MSWLKLVLEVDRKSFQTSLDNAGHTSASIANCCNWGVTDLKIHKDILVVYDRIENRWFIGETMGIQCAAASLMRRLFSSKIGTDCGKHAENAHAPTFEAGFTIFGLMISTIKTLAFFCRVDSRILETHPTSGTVRVASIGSVTSAIGAISLVLFPIVELILIHMIVRLQLLRSAAGRTFITSASLRGTVSIIYESFNFFLDCENEIGKEFTLGRRRTSQVVNRRRGSVGLLTVEVQIRLHFKCQTKCFLNHCWFGFSDFPANDRIGQPFDESSKQDLIAHGIVGISFT